MNPTVKTWLKGLASVTLSGGATGATQVIATTGTVNKGTAVVAGIGALVGLLNYLIKSPLQSSQVPAAASAPVEPEPTPEEK